MADATEKILEQLGTRDRGVPWAGMDILKRDDPPGVVNLMAFAQGRQVGADIKESLRRREIAERQRLAYERELDANREAAAYLAPYQNNYQIAVGMGKREHDFFVDQVNAVRNDPNLQKLSPESRAKVWANLEKIAVDRADRLRKIGRTSEARAMLDAVGGYYNEYDEAAQYGRADDMLALAEKQSRGQIKQVSDNVYAVGGTLVPREWVVARLQQNKGLQNIYQEAMEARNNLFDAQGNWIAKQQGTTTTDQTGGTTGGTTDGAKTDVSTTPTEAELNKLRANVTFPNIEGAKINELYNLYTPDAQFKDANKRAEEYYKNRYGLSIPTLSKERFDQLTPEAKNMYSYLNSLIVETRMLTDQLESKYGALNKLRTVSDEDLKTLGYKPEEVRKASSLISGSKQRELNAVLQLEKLVNSVRGY